MSGFSELDYIEKITRLETQMGAVLDKLNEISLLFAQSGKMQVMIDRNNREFPKLENEVAALKDEVAALRKSVSSTRAFAAGVSAAFGFVGGVVGFVWKYWVG